MPLDVSKAGRAVKGGGGSVENIKGSIRHWQQSRELVSLYNVCI